MINKNNFGLTIISFLSYYLTGSMIVVTGFIIHNIAEYFHLSIANMSNTFTFLNAGILFAILINSWITKFVTLKKQIIFGFLLIILSIIGFIESNNLLIFCTSLFILGIVGGITMSIGTFLITSIYSGKERTEKLLLTDSCFSMSGMIFPGVTSYLLHSRVMWYWIYGLIGVIYCFIFLITLCVKFPELIHNSEKNQNLNNQKYKVSVIILCSTALLYILGQLGFISWIPEFTIQNINLNFQFSGKLVSSFWMSYMLGMWFFSYVLKFFDLQKSLTILTGISTMLMYIFINNKYNTLFNIIIILLGFFSSAIYTVIITLTSLQTKYPSQKLINWTLTSGTVGTLLTFITTGPIVNSIGIYGALIISNILYTIVFILSYMLKFTSRHKKNF